LSTGVPSQERDGRMREQLRSVVGARIWQFSSVRAYSPIACEIAREVNGVRCDLAHSTSLSFEGSCRASCLSGKVVSAVMPAPVGARPDEAQWGHSCVCLCVCAHARTMKLPLMLVVSTRSACPPGRHFAHSACGGGHRGSSNAQHQTPKKYNRQADQRARQRAVDLSRR
jgi:hypothetical protein